MQICFKELDIAGLDFLETASEVWFILDILVCFNTAFYDKGLVVTERKLIALNYLRTWFVLDFMTSIPYSIVIQKVKLL